MQADAFEGGCAHHRRRCNWRGHSQGPFHEGAKVLLTERGDFAAGATGANHGMLHSGARYAVNDPASARECAEEGRILKRIARFCIEDTGGLFVAAGEDDARYMDRFLPACRDAGIGVREIGVDEALEMEAGLDKSIQAAVEVPDASLDPFFLTLGNVNSARGHGATVLNHSPVQSIRRTGSGFEVTIGRGRRERRISADVIVNAAGSWAGEVAAMLGASIPICVDKGTLVVFNGRLVNRLVNRLRPPSDGDILVPHRTATILGTTSSPGMPGGGGDLGGGGASDRSGRRRPSRHPGGKGGTRICRHQATAWQREDRPRGDKDVPGDRSWQGWDRWTDQRRGRKVDDLSSHGRKGIGCGNGETGARREVPHCR